MEFSGAIGLIALLVAAGVTLFVLELVLALPGVSVRIPGLAGFKACADRSLSYGEAG